MNPSDRSGTNAGVLCANFYRLFSTMSKAPLLRCDSRSSPGALNMVASMHDFINTCDTKPVVLDATFQDEDLDKSSLTIPTDFDHMYASSIEEGGINDSVPVELYNHLKDILLLHLDLIQHQSEQLVVKDKELATLSQENENLSSPLFAMGGDHHGHEPYKVPDYKVYKVEDAPQLVAVQRKLAVKGLKDPWLRNEVWRYDVEQFGTVGKNFRNLFFRGFKWGALAFAITIGAEKLYDYVYPPKHHHGAHH